MFTNVMQFSALVTLIFVFFTSSLRHTRKFDGTSHSTHPSLKNLLHINWNYAWIEKFLHILATLWHLDKYHLLLEDDPSLCLGLFNEVAMHK